MKSTTYSLSTRMSSNIFSKIDSLDYWMAVAFLLGARSPSRNAALITENSAMVAAGIDTPPHVGCSSGVLIPAEAVAIMNCGVELSNASIFVTRTPDFHVAALIMAKRGLRKVVYYPTSEIDQKTGELLQGFFGEVVEYDGNLNWVYDYFGSIDL